MSKSSEILKIANEIESLDSGLAVDMKKTAKELEKKSALINPGDRIVCLNPIQGIYKGRIYLVDKYVGPNQILITEEDGTKVGIFRADRFCLDNNEY